MRLRSLIAIVAALVIAGGAAFVVRGWMQAERAALARAAADANRTKPTQKVLVAKADIGRGQFIRPEHLRWQSWPEDGIAQNYVLEGKRPLEEFVGAVARDPIGGGEPVTDSRVVQPGSGGFLAAVLQPGMRAVSVPVTATSGISGFVFPGDRVDLILTHVLPKEENRTSSIERRASETVLRDVRVLAIDQKVEGKPGEALVAKTTTLEVTPKQSEVIAVAVDMGKLSLALRSLAAHDQEAQPRTAGTAAGPNMPQSRTEPPAMPPLAADTTVQTTAETAAATTAPAAAATEQAANGKALRRDVTYTLDSDVSRLLPSPFGKSDKKEVTVLRGQSGPGGKAAKQQ